MNDATKCDCKAICHDLNTVELCGKQWHWFLLSSAASYFAGLLILLICRHFYSRWMRSAYDRRPTNQYVAQYESPFLTPERIDKFQHTVFDHFLSVQTGSGKCTAILYFLFNVISVTLYINQSDQPLEQCKDVLNTCNWTLYADIGLNVFFLFHFLLRLIAAPNRLKFWFQMGSIVDFCTIPPCALALILERNWLGMRFMRALRFMQMGEILMTFNSTGTVVSFGGGGGGGGVRRRTWNKPFSGAGQSGGPPDSDVGRSHSRSSVDVRGGSKSNLAKAAKQVNDARFTKVKDPVKKSTDPRFSKASASPPKKSDAGGGGGGAKQVKQKMTTRKTDQGNRKGGGGGGGGGGMMMEQDGGYLERCM